ncbi:hypothetical protein [Microbacterium sp. NPDC055665]
MNQFGLLLRDFWKSHRPKAYAEIPDPESFFTRAGEEISLAIAELTPTLAGADLPGEEALAKVARLANARAQATEMALMDSGLWTDPEISREEWEGSTQDHVEALIDWAWLMAEQLEGEANHDLTIEAAASRFLLPPTFLQEMAEATSPRAFLKEPEHWAVWLDSIEMRWVRDSTTP